jgi:hypothetical protein
MEEGGLSRSDGWIRFVTLSEGTEDEKAEILRVLKDDLPLTQPGPLVAPAAVNQDASMFGGE